jgi:hypothetical protein
MDQPKTMVEAKPRLMKQSAAEVVVEQKGIYSNDINCVEKRKLELLLKYPQA